MIKLLTSIVLLLIFFPKIILAHETGEITIHIGQNGFEPAEITINTDDTVMFENTDKVAHWPASDIHPSHGIYPEFDPKKGLEPASTWEFTFKKPGEWSMHDHLFPEFIGKIIVQGNETSNPPSKNDFLNKLLQDLKVKFYKLLPFYSDPKFKDMDIYKLTRDRENLTFWMRVKGSKILMNKLLEQAGGGSITDCHQEAHVLGRVAFELFGKEAFASGDLACHSGFYHGAMEGFLKKNGTQNLAKNIAEICEGFETNFGNFECLHGVGHGILAYKNYDLPKAIEACGLLPDLFQQSSCYGGVFMENIIVGQGQSVDLDHHTDWLSDDPHFPCNALDQNNTALQTQCYMMQTSRMLYLYSYDYEKVIEQCSRVNDTLMPVCFQSLGRDIAGNVLRKPEGIVELCSKVPSKYHQVCITGALNVIIDFWGDKMEGYPHELCSKLTSSEKEVCFTNLSTRLKDIYGTDKVAIKKSCGLMNEYESPCLEISAVN